MSKDEIHKFIKEILVQIEKLNIDVSNLELDHFGYQTSSAEDYDAWKQKVSTLGNLVNEAIVGGRRVGIFRFQEPMQIEGYVISAFELIEPKEGQVAPSALEHVEFVLKEPFEDFIEKYPGVNFDLSAMDRPEFPKVQLKLTPNTGVKFHPKNIFDEISKSA